MAFLIQGQNVLNEEGTDYLYMVKNNFVLHRVCFHWVPGYFTLCKAAGV